MKDIIKKHKQTKLLITNSTHAALQVPALQSDPEEHDKGQKSDREVIESPQNDLELQTFISEYTL